MKCIHRTCAVMFRTSINRLQHIFFQENIFDQPHVDCGDKGLKRAQGVKSEGIERVK